MPHIFPLSIKCTLQYINIKTYNTFVPKYNLTITKVPLSRSLVLGISLVVMYSTKSYVSVFTTSKKVVLRVGG